MTYEKSKRWCVDVFSKSFIEEWHFKSFRKAMRFAKKNLKKGWGVTIEYAVPQYCSYEGERKWKSRKNATSAVAR